MQSYASDFWQVFGINALDIWDLEFEDFIAMTMRVDQVRREMEKPAK